jgi:hypothetical protein
MSRLFVVLLVLLPLTSLAAPLTLSAEDWTQWRAARMPAPGLPELLAALERDATSVVLVRHAHADAAARWAQELRDWLVARGLPSARIELRPGGLAGEQLELEVQAGGVGR